MKRENTRMDIITHQAYPRDMLVRLVLSDGVVRVDKDSTMPGRGYYLLKDKTALESQKGIRALSRAFHRPLTEEELDAIKEAL
ncbi:MAG: DUF448 domain-containing protein [Bacilli bacterium]|nr:DUF448 domain-containing protein [Bacilli bacterium]